MNPQQQTSYTVMEPGLARELDSPGYGFTAGQNVSFDTSISFLQVLAFSACLGAAALSYVIAGFNKINLTEDGQRKWKERFTRATYGLIGASLLFLLMVTVNRSIVTGGLSTELLANQGGVVNQTNTNEPASNQQSLPGYPGNGTENLQKLNAAGIRINHANIPCTQTQLTESAPRCTSVDGLPTDTINMLIKLNNECTVCGGIEVTGGTEPGHDTHGPGKYAVDLARQSDLLNFLKTKAQPINSETYLWGGYTFWDERSGATAKTTGVHFHVYKK